MLLDLPVARSAFARTLLLLAAVISAICVFWIQKLRLTGDPHGLAPIFYVLFTFDDYYAAMLALGILLGAMFVPYRYSFGGLLRWLGMHPWQIAAAVAVVFSVGTLTVYRNHPLCMDEYAQFFQSQVFASGHLLGIFPVELLDSLVPPGFQGTFLTVSKATGAVASSYWPSFALLLSPFTFLGIPWACNPVISGLTIVVMQRVALRLFTEVETAGLVVLLTAASPVFFADGISYYSMSAHLLANAIFVLLLLEPTAKRLLTAGVVGSIALTLHNPVPHILFALPWFVWIATRDQPVRKLLWLCAGYLPLCLLLGLGWFLLLGHLHEAHGASGAVAGSLRALTVPFAFPTPAVLYARLVGITKLWLWAVPGLLLLAAYGGWKLRRDSRLITLVACAVLTLAGYLFVWADQGHGWGFRYFHSAWLVLPLLAAGTLMRNHAKPETTAAQPSDEARTFVVACAILSLVGGVSLHAYQIRDFITNDLRQLPQYAGTEPRVVAVNAETGFYALDLVQNDPYLRRNEIRVVYEGAAQIANLMRTQFPTYRRVYVDDGGEVWSAAGASH
jgi:hypothetical protein